MTPELLNYMVRLFLVLRRGYITSHLEPLFLELIEVLKANGVDPYQTDEELTTPKMAAVALPVTPKKSKKSDEGEITNG